MAVVHFSYFSTARRGMTQCAAILPLEKPQKDQVPGESIYQEGPFPTLYLLHGYSGDHNDWLTRFRLEEWATQSGLAVIMPYGGNYFYLDNQDTDILYGEQIGLELVGITRSMFSLSHKREDTAIGGLSMGGYGAIRNGLKYSQTFGAIIALSAALITEEIAHMKEGERNVLQSYSYFRHVFGEVTQIPGSDRDPKHLIVDLLDKGSEMPRLFLSCGADDFLYLVNRDFHTYLDTLNVPHVWRVPSGSHDFDFWNQELTEAIHWFSQGR